MWFFKKVPPNFKIEKNEYDYIAGFLKAFNDYKKYYYVDPPIEPTDTVPQWITKVEFLVRVIVKRMNVLHCEIDELETELIKRKSSFSQQAKLITKCGCAQYIDMEMTSDEYLIPLVGEVRKFRYSTTKDGVRIYQEV